MGGVQCGEGRVQFIGVVRRVHGEWRESSQAGLGARISGLWWTVV